jgi:GWxTD domain-containing protein
LILSNFVISATALFKRSILCLCFCLPAAIDAYAQPEAWYASCVFNIPGKQPFIETYLTLSSRTLKATHVQGKLRNSVGVEISISRHGDLVRQNKYNLFSPLLDGPQANQAFIDIQRYALPEGNYEVRLQLRDNLDTTQKPLEFVDDIKINFSDSTLQFSGLQAVERWNKVSQPGPYSKSGFDMVPYNTNYYSSVMDQMLFYTELYHADRMLGEGKPLVFTWYIENTSDHSPISQAGSFRKARAAEVNPLLGGVDLTRIGSGYYDLVIEVRDESNRVIATKRHFFIRTNSSMDNDAQKLVSDRQTIQQYFGNCNNADTLRMFVECLWPIADHIDKERTINQSLKKNPEMMKHFIIDFWERRAADTANPLKLWMTYYKQVQAVMILFKCGKQKGYFTDRGRVYLQYGPPSQRTQQTNEQNTFPYEIWHYYNITDGSTRRTFSNRKFVFVNKMIGDDCHSLVHSDMQGEVNNPRWQFEVTRRNSDGLSNPDNTIPAGTQSNQFNDLYSVPR